MPKTNIFSFIMSDQGIALCHKESGFFFLIRSTDELIDLTNILKNLCYSTPDLEDLFHAD